MSADAFTQDFVPTEPEEFLRTLAERYAKETEAYDRTVCTGPIVRGSIQPADARQLALIGRASRIIFAHLCVEAEAKGLSVVDLRRAIGAHYRREA